MADSKIGITIQVRDGQAKSALQRFQSSMASSFSNARKSLKSFGAHVVVLNQGMQLLSRLGRMAGQAIVGPFRDAAEASEAFRARVDTVSRAMTRLDRDFGNALAKSASVNGIFGSLTLGVQEFGKSLQTSEGAKLIDDIAKGVASFGAGAINAFLGVRSAWLDLTGEISARADALVSIFTLDIKTQGGRDKLIGDIRTLMRGAEIEIQDHSTPVTNALQNLADRLEGVATGRIPAAVKKVGFATTKSLEEAQKAFLEFHAVDLKSGIDQIALTSLPGLANAYVDVARKTAMLAQIDPFERLREMDPNLANLFGTAELTKFEQALTRTAKFESSIGKSGSFEEQSKQFEENVAFAERYNLTMQETVHLTEKQREAIASLSASWAAARDGGINFASSITRGFIQSAFAGDKFKDTLKNLGKELLAMAASSMIKMLLQLAFGLVTGGTSGFFAGFLGGLFGQHGGRVPGDLKPMRFAAGGPVPNTGTDRDVFPALLRRGEFVLTPEMMAAGSSGGSRTVVVNVQSMGEVTRSDANRMARDRVKPAFERLERNRVRTNVFDRIPGR